MFVLAVQLSRQEHNVLAIREALWSLSDNSVTLTLFFHSDFASTARGAVVLVSLASSVRSIYSKLCADSQFSVTTRQGMFGKV